MQDRTRREDTDSRLLRKSLVCGHFRRGTGWSEAHKESSKAFVHRCAPPQVERNCHRALTALTNGQDSLKAHPGRKQTGGKMLPFVPPCSILSGTQPLSGRWRMIPSFCPVSCSRCGRSFIAPGPRGHICPQCQKERRMNREKSSVRIPRTTRTAESRAQTNVEARSSRAVEPVRVPVQLVESRWQAPDGIASSLWRAFRMLWSFPLSVRPPEHEPSFAAYLLLICLKATCPSRNLRVFLWRR